MRKQTLPQGEGLKNAPSNHFREGKRNQKK